MRNSILCLTAIACLLGGCNQPAVTLKAPAFQSSENTVRDWNDIAHRISSEMASRGLLPSPSVPAAPNTPSPRPVFVQVQAPDSAFVRVLASELQADVLRNGGIVARSPYGATVVNLDVDFVSWSRETNRLGSSGPRQPSPPYPGSSWGLRHRCPLGPG